MPPRRQRRAAPVFPDKPAPEDRPLLSPEQAADLAALFKIFAGQTRLRLLHALVRRREMRVTSLAAEIGMKPQAVSNQLRRLVKRGILATRRDGLNIHYRINDPCVSVLLERGLCLIECCPE